MSQYELSFNTHGKGRVRLVKVIRNPDGTQDILQYSVQLLLEGDNMETAFTEGDNSIVVPTDTCKNTVYCVASTNNFSSIEEFGTILCRHFLNEYPKIVNKITVTIHRDIWKRLEVPDSQGVVVPHKHAFQRFGPLKPYTIVVGEKRPDTEITLQVTSGFKSLEILKTTQSGFVGFPKDRYTSLPEVTDRLVGTSADSEWKYNPEEVNKGSIDYSKTFDDITESLITTFAGPADVGVYSPSVQETLYKMAVGALESVSSIGEITLLMPNLHNMVFNLATYGFENADETGKPNIFYPIDEPHGMIKATVKRAGVPAL